MPGQVILPAGDEALQREGLDPVPAAWEDGLCADTGPGNFEWWYFDAHLDDGSTAVIVFFTKSLIRRNDPLTPAVQLSITRPDGVKLLAIPQYPASQFSAGRGNCAVSTGPNWVKGDLHRYELRAEAPQPGSGAPPRRPTATRRSPFSCWPRALAS